MAFSNVLVSTLHMERNEWREWRRRGIGGSDAAAVAGLSRWRSPVQVWLEKTGQIEHVEDSEAMYWGRILEDVVAKEFVERTGKKVRRRHAILQHPSYPFMIANVDRMVVGEDAGLECKTAGAWGRDEWANDAIPEEHVIQCQHYMAVTGLTRWYIAVLIGGQHFLWQAIERDEEIVGYLIQIEKDFWRLVETNVPPAMDGTDSSTQALKILYPESQGSVIELPQEADGLISEREAVKATISTYETQLARIENQLKAMLGDAEAGVIGNKVVSWKTIVSKRIEPKQIREHYPEIYEECSKEALSALRDQETKQK